MFSIFNHVSKLEKPKVLFILKQREASYENETEAEGQYYCGVLHSGLYNSANFINEMLKGEGYESNIVHVIDNNCIDKVVTKFKPDVVIIEAFWVVPEKFDVLYKLHPTVKWVIRNHSKTPFLANEGVAFGWILKYASKPNVFVASNANDTNEEIISLLRVRYKWSRAEAAKRALYLPNYYPIDDVKVVVKPSSDVINISCFGAIRPLKNHMIQAIAAIKFAESIGKKVRFHINGNRIEGNGNGILKNLQQLFEDLPHELVEHQWQPHDKFLKTVGEMDIGLQVSYTETFNIVAADHIKMGVPVIVSDEIDWITPCMYADPNDSDDIVRVLKEVYYLTRRKCIKKLLLKVASKRLQLFDKHAINSWKTKLHKLKS